MKRLLLLLLPAAVMASMTMACEPIDVGPGDAAYEGGHLGNGGFAFTCDDSVVCGHYDAARSFPDAVALGSRFTVRYIPKSGDSTGVTLSGVSQTELTTLGAGNFTAVGEGIATIVAKDSGGTLLEWVEIPVRRPDAIVITESDSTAPISKTTLDSAAYDRRQFRATARYQSTDLAGSLSYEWSASDADVISVQGDSDGSAFVTPMKPGTATLTATGGTFSQSIEVEVR